MQNTLNYYENYSSSLSIKYESANVIELQKLILKTFDKNSILLDIGCGSGRDTSFMIENNYDVIGIDGSKNMIEEAKQIHPELKGKLLYKTLPYDLDFDKTFDGIYSIATLMHLSEIELKETILKIYNLLNQNGKFLMSVSLYRDGIDINGLDDKKRFFLVLSFEQWVDILKNVGFKILATKTNSDGLNRDDIQWLTLVASK